MNLSKKRLIFVTGKGGVGKSLMAASLALQEASAGRKVCLVELGQQSFYESFFETRGINYEPSEVIPQVHISLLTPDEALREYILHYLKVTKLYEILFQNKVMKAFINAAPALPELSILGKLTSDIRDVLPTDYDVMVVDCFSTGHALALLRAPRGLSETFKVGPLNEQARSIDQVLCNNELVKYVVVTIPEELPVNESKELVQQLKAEFNADVSVICNQISLSNLNATEKQELKSKLKDPGALEFTDYVIEKEQWQSQNMKKLKDAFGTYWGVELVLKNVKGQELIESIVPQLEKPWDLTNS